MPNYNQAPLLEFTKPKESFQSDWNWVIPNTIMRQVYTKLTKLNEIKLISFLLGQSDSSVHRFAVAENTVLCATGMDHKAYIKAREGLVERGWITLIPRQSIILNMDEIMK